MIDDEACLLATREHPHIVREDVLFIPFVLMAGRSSWTSLWGIVLLIQTFTLLASGKQHHLSPHQAFERSGHRVTSLGFLLVSFQKSRCSSRLLHVLRTYPNFPLQEQAFQTLQAWKVGIHV